MGSAAAGGAGPELALDDPVGSFAVPSFAALEAEASIAQRDDITKPDDDAEESSAGHLPGSSAAVVGEVDAKFQRLLAEAHENRPGDDLEIIRRAWAFCSAAA